MGPSQWGVKGGGDFFLWPSPPHTPTNQELFLSLTNQELPWHTRSSPRNSPPPQASHFSPPKLPLPWLHFPSRKVRIPVLSIFLFWVHYWVSFLIGGCIYIVKMEEALKEREKAVEMKEAMHRVILTLALSFLTFSFYVHDFSSVVDHKHLTILYHLNFVFGVYYSSVHSQKFRFHKLAHKKHWKIHRGYYCRKVRQFWRSHWFYGIYGMGFTWPVLLCRTF